MREYKNDNKRLNALEPLREVFKEHQKEEYRTKGENKTVSLRISRDRKIRA